MKGKGISPNEMLTDRVQGDLDSQPSDDEVEGDEDEDETLETFIRTVPDASEATKLTLSPTVPEGQFGVITPHVPSVTSVKKVVVQMDEYLKKSEVETTVDEPMFISDSISKPLKKVPSLSMTTPGSARLRDPLGQLSRKMTGSLQPVKFNAKDPVFSEKFSSPVSYQEKLHRQIWPDSSDTEALNKGYYTLEAARKLAGPGYRSEDQPDPTGKEADMSSEEIELLIKCYMASNIIKGMPQNVD